MVEKREKKRTRRGNNKKNRNKNKKRKKEEEKETLGKGRGIRGGGGKKEEGKGKTKRKKNEEKAKQKRSKYDLKADIKLPMGCGHSLRNPYKQIGSSRLPDRIPQPDGAEGSPTPSSSLIGCTCGSALVHNGGEVVVVMSLFRSRHDKTGYKSTHLLA